MYKNSSCYIYYLLQTEPWKTERGLLWTAKVEHRLAQFMIDFKDISENISKEKLYQYLNQEYTNQTQKCGLFMITETWPAFSTRILREYKEGLNSGELADKITRQIISSSEVAAIEGKHYTPSNTPITEPEALVEAVEVPKENTKVDNSSANHPNMAGSKPVYKNPMHDDIPFKPSEGSFMLG